VLSLVFMPAGHFGNAQLPKTTSPPKMNFNALRFRRLADF
jgi:hypothetical protein